MSCVMTVFKGSLAITGKLGQIKLDKDNSKLAYKLISHGNLSCKTWPNLHPCVWQALSSHAYYTSNIFVPLCLKFRLNYCFHP